MAAKTQRNIDNKFLNSGNDAQSIEYNPASGGQKALLVGPRLLPIPNGAAAWKTNITVATALPLPGATLWIYNNAGAAGSVTVGHDATVTALAIGAVDASGHVGVACPPNQYTQVSMGFNQWIIGNAATLICYIVEDPTFFTQQTPQLVPQNNGNTQPIS